MTRKKGKRRNRSRNSNSTIHDHRLIGKELIPPMVNAMRQTGMQHKSWLHGRLPEVLWACLIVSALPRDQVLKIFLEIAEQIGFALRDKPGAIGFDISHTSLASDQSGAIEKIAEIVSKHSSNKDILAPLLLFDSLPGLDRWKNALRPSSDEHDGGALAQAVGVCLDHQSQESTDVRWLTVMVKIASGKLHTSPEMVRGFLSYTNRSPDDEEMRSLRPSVRALEISLRGGSPDCEDNESPWAMNFWAICLDRTECLPDPKSVSEQQPALEIDREALIAGLRECARALFDHSFATRVTSGVDAKHDAVIGFGFYAISILFEVSFANNRLGIAGRALLRILLECRVTLAYLLTKDSSELWSKFRAFGAGQAKLALLKFDDALFPPKFLSEEALTHIANEDFYEEFVAIDLGHWCDSDLRAMAVESSTKADYDSIYGWSSAYVHGNWSALRDACFVTCFNPLHRLHRIPRPGYRFLEDVVTDAIDLFNKVADSVDQAYPGYLPRINVPSDKESKRKGADSVNSPDAI